MSSLELRGVRAGYKINLRYLQQPVYGFAQFFHCVRLVNDLADADRASARDQTVVDRTADQHDTYIRTDREQLDRDIEPRHAGHAEVRDHQVDTPGLGLK